MTIEHWAFIALGNGREDPDRQRAVIEFDGLRSVFAVVPDVRRAVELAGGLVAAGAQAIELCGAFTAADVAAVRAALDPAVPVGVVSYGPDSVAAFAAIL